MDVPPLKLCVYSLGQVLHESAFSKTRWKQCCQHFDQAALVFIRAICNNNEQPILFVHKLYNVHGFLPCILYRTVRYRKLQKGRISPPPPPPPHTHTYGHIYVGGPPISETTGDKDGRNPHAHKLSVSEALISDNSQLHDCTIEGPPRPLNNSPRMKGCPMH